MFIKYSLLKKILLYPIVVFFFFNNYSYSSDIKNFKKREFCYNIKIDTLQKNKILKNSNINFDEIPSDLCENFSSTFSFDKDKIYWISGIAGITAGLIIIDSKFDLKVKNLKIDHKWINNTSPYLTNFGSGYGALISGIYAAYSITTGYKKGEATSLLLLESSIYSTIWTRFWKVIFGRERPSAYYNNPVHAGGKWYGPFVQIKNKAKLPVSSYDAFPSGHTSFAFSLATVFAEQYKSTFYVPITAYSLATIVGITRTVEHTHWLSDVFVGACIGYFSGKSTIMIYKSKMKRVNEKEIKLNIEPDIFNNGLGANLTF